MTTSASLDLLRSAAFRLKHDVGKAVRFRAADPPETDPEALRERLRADLLDAKRVNGRARSVFDLFGEWKREEGDALSESSFGSDVDALERRLGELAADAARLDTLDEPALRRLDALAADVGALCSGLFRRVAERPS